MFHHIRTEIKPLIRVTIMFQQCIHALGRLVHTPRRSNHCTIGGYRSRDFFLLASLWTSSANGRLCRKLICCCVLYCFIVIKQLFKLFCFERMFNVEDVDKCLCLVRMSQSRYGVIWLKMHPYKQICTTILQFYRSQVFIYFVNKAVLSLESNHIYMFFDVYPFILGSK